MGRRFSSGHNLRLPMSFLFFLLVYSHAKGGMDMAFTLKSDAFKDRDVVPREYTCEGSDMSPPLIWENPPAGTKSFSLIVEDPDAPMGTFTHWVIYDIPAALKGLKGGVSASATLEDGTKQGVNDFGKTGYGGPCPPRGHGRHRYYFTLRALNVVSLGITPRSSKADVEKAMKGHVLAEAKLTGVFER